MHAHADAELLAECSADDDHSHEAAVPFCELLLSDWRPICLLVLLYTIQGAPLGLTGGALQYLLKRSCSYTELGVFAMASYPYSLKLLWAPVVDAIYSPRVGRRLSWILPAQLVSGLLMLALSAYQPLHAAVRELAPGAAAPGFSIYTITAATFLVVLATATQDIAVDGWAIEMLSRRNRGHASTVQSIGLNLGFFGSFTLFLALNSVEFSQRWVPLALPPGTAAVSLAGMLRFLGLCYLAVTALLWLGVRESDLRAADSTADSPSYKPGEVYGFLWQLMRRPSMRRFAVLLLVLKFAFVADNNVSALKLMERGFAAQDMALVAVIDFPFALAFAALAGRWATRRDPFSAFQRAFQLRLAFVALDGVLVWLLPVQAPESAPLGMGMYLVLIALSLGASFADSVMFVSMGAWFAHVADDTCGGTYLTLLNTLSNLGSAWPKFFMLAAVDTFSVGCVPGGACALDGYFVVMSMSGVFGLVLATCYLPAELHYIASLPRSAWRVF